MSVWLHKAMEMPSNGKALSGFGCYWSIDDDCWPHEDADMGVAEEEDEMYHACRRVVNGAKGEYIITTTLGEGHPRDELVSHLGAALYRLPQNKEWWYGFALLLQRYDVHPTAHCAMMAFRLSQGYTPQEAAEHYDDEWELAQYPSKETLIEHLVASYREANGPNTTFSDEELWEAVVSARFNLFKYADEWYAERIA